MIIITIIITPITIPMQTTKYDYNNNNNNNNNNNKHNSDNTIITIIIITKIKTNSK